MIRFFVYNLQRHQRSMMRIFTISLALVSANAFVAKYPTPGKLYRRRHIDLAGTPSDTPFANPDHDLLVRVARGEVGERTPVWLMRQAGRYMKDFRKYSDKYGFRKRSETPEIAIELSLQCWRAYGMDGVIMFSDILTPLPALGIEFDVIKGKGPVISNSPRTKEAVDAMTELGVRS